MIAVIADDFTGAAEIGGIGLRRGLKVVIETKVNAPNDTDLLIIATDTRSMHPQDAIDEIDKVTKDIQKLKPEYTFKKLDSVLRGNVVDELKAQMNGSGNNKVLVVAGNPHFNRIIKDGIYFVNGVPLSDTFFASDPQYPITTSNVLEILKDKDVEMVSASEELPEKGILMANVNCVDELIQWSEKADDSMLLAGGAGFFDMLLKKRYPLVKKAPVNHYPLGDKTLFVFGSTFPKSENFLKQLHTLGMSVCNMPEEIFIQSDPVQKVMNKWASDIVSELEAGKKVVVTISHTSSGGVELSNRIKQSVGTLVKKVIDHIELDDLLIEGGDTTSAILKHINVAKLEPYCELGHGVIQMKAEKYPRMCITTKPGSYFWPDEIILNGNHN
ncbi:MAG: hypothetical protein PF436_12550 [Prolixibacteraceae bacterium]|jgi:uncharacterized protein YgbK (DUF1537 family)|nr:hypothetical protein [Prolixibacteraceae bacterium]